MFSPAVRWAGRRDDSLRLYTIGHGTAPIDDFIASLQKFEIEALVDVRRYAGSRRNPQYNSDALEHSLADARIEYRNDVALGGRRKPSPDSTNVGLRNEAFRAYADYMETPEFRIAFDALLAQAQAETTVIMCSETVWWRCHRRLISDAVVLLAGGTVEHIVAGAARPHIPTEGVRREGDRLHYGVSV